MDQGAVRAVVGMEAHQPIDAWMLIHLGQHGEAIAIPEVTGIDVGVPIGTAECGNGLEAGSQCGIHAAIGPARHPGDYSWIPDFTDRLSGEGNGGIRRGSVLDDVDQGYLGIVIVREHGLAQHGCDGAGNPFLTISHGSDHADTHTSTLAPAAARKDMYGRGRVCSVLASRVRWSPVWLLVALYVLATAVTILAWDSRGLYGLSGDEPHYLVMFDAATTDRTMDVEAAYRREFVDPTFYPQGLAGADASVVADVKLAPPAAHVVATERGLFSWHGWGAALPAGLGWWSAGAPGVKAVMALAGIAVVGTAWWVSGLVGSWLRRSSARFIAVAGVALAYPVLLASTQAFPDLWAGAILLVLVALMMAIRGGADSAVFMSSVPARWLMVLAGLGLGFLPWLGMKFAPAAFVAAIALIALLIRTQGRWATDRLSFLLLAVPIFFLWLGLGVYHLWAFGSILGPPTQGTLAFGSAFAMVLPGLIFDQNQGALASNPLLWMAVPGLVIFLRRYGRIAAIWAALFVLVWVPGAAHPGLYGLGSLNGRYSWALSCLLVIPSLIGLGWLWQRWRVGFWIATSLGVFFQIYLFALSVFIAGAGPGLPAGLDLYTRPPETWLESYSAWWFPFQNFLPAWYSIEWAFTFPPNYVWLAIAVAVALIPVIRRRMAVLVAGLLGIVGVGLAGILGSPGVRSVAVDQGVSARTDGGAPGYVAQGPLHLMRSGSYHWWVAYRAHGIDPVGKWELVRVADDVVVAAGELAGTEDDESLAAAIIPFRSLQPQEFLLRIGWYATADMSVDATGVQYGDGSVIPNLAQDRE